MTLNGLIAELDRRGMTLDVRDGYLRVSKASALDDNLRAALRRHKAQIMEEAKMPFFDYVLCVFGGEVIDATGGQTSMEVGDADAP